MLDNGYVALGLLRYISVPVRGKLTTGTESKDHILDVILSSQDSFRTLQGNCTKVNQQVLSDAYKHARRVVIAVIGGTVFLLGLILVVPGVPGPGLIGILAGLAILGIEFAWARRWLRKIKKKAKEAAAWYRNEGGTRKS